MTQAKKSTWKVSEAAMKRMEETLNEQKKMSLREAYLEPEQLTQECDSIFICLVCLGIVKLNMKECRDCRALFCEDCITKNNSIQIHSCPKCREKFVASEKLHYLVVNMLKELVFKCKHCP